MPTDSGEAVDISRLGLAARLRAWTDIDVAPGYAFQVREEDWIGRRTVPQDGAESRDAVNPCFDDSRPMPALVQRKMRCPSALIQKRRFAN
jgi:hypothetical protein